MINHIIFDGTSLTQSDLVNDYPHQLVAKLSGAWTHTNVSAGGHTGQQMLADFAAQVAPLYDASKHQAIAFEMGINDLQLGVDKETVKVRYRDYFDRCRALGLAPNRIFIRPLSSRPDFAQFTRATQLEINRWLRLMFPQSCVDHESEPRIFGERAYLDRTYFNADQLHPTAAGDALVAGAMRKKMVVEGFLPNEFSMPVGSRSKAKSMLSDFAIASHWKKPKAVAA